MPWLESLSPREIVLGLERVTVVLERLNLPRPGRVISVAGTNGKGSTVAMLEAFYRAAGCTVACYTSPHVLRFNERMRVAGEPLDDATIVRALQTVEAARDDVPLTFFEFGTLAALVAFTAARADVWVLEIGLGGRLDAVNALSPDGSVITNVSLDHCAWLGPDLESIGREKAGVMRAGTPVVFAGASVPASVLDAATSVGASLLLAGRDFHAQDFGAAADELWSLTYADDAPLVLPKPSLAGAFQVANAAGALALFFALEGASRLEHRAVADALRTLRVAGRMQQLRTTRNWLLDVAHNPAAAEVLAAELERRQLTGRTIAVIGVLADKDFEAMVRPLLPRVDYWVAVTPQGPRALAALQLATRIAHLGHCPCRVAADMSDALGIAASLAGNDDLIVVTGSFYTVGPALEALEKSAGL